MDIKGVQCRFSSVVISLEEGWIFYDFHYRFSTLVTPPEEGEIFMAMTAYSCSWPH